MKKGFSLLELVIVIALVGILLSVASLSVKRVTEKRALEKAKTEVAGIMRIYVDKSFHEGEVYKVLVSSPVDSNGGSIKVSKKVTGSPDLVVEELELPQNLNYSTSGDGVTLGEITTVVETVNETLEVYIKDGDKNEKYKVEIFKNVVTNLVTIDVYEY